MSDILNEVIGENPQISKTTFFTPSVEIATKLATAPAVKERTETFFVVGVTLFMRSGIIIAGTFRGGMINPPRYGWKSGATALSIFEAAYGNKKIVPIHTAIIVGLSSSSSIKNKSKVPLVYVNLADTVAVIPKVKNHVYQEDE